MFPMETGSFVRFEGHNSFCSASITVFEHSIRLYLMTLNSQQSARNLNRKSTGGHYYAIPQQKYPRLPSFCHSIISYLPTFLLRVSVQDCYALPVAYPFVIASHTDKTRAKYEKINSMCKIKFRRSVRLQILSPARNVGDPRLLHSVVPIQHTYIVNVILLKRRT